MNWKVRIVVALDTSRKELLSTMTECDTRREELEFRINEFCKKNADLEEKNVEVMKHSRIVMIMVGKSWRKNSNSKIIVYKYERPKGK